MYYIIFTFILLFDVNQKHSHLSSLIFFSIISQLEYYKRGHKHGFIVLIKRGIHEAKLRKTNTAVILGILNSLLAAHYIAEGVALPAIEKKRTVECLEEATDCLNEAEKRNPNYSEDFNIRKGKIFISISCNS